MQRINHGTRAYIWNADGLQGFLNYFNPILELQRAFDGINLEDIREKKLEDIRALDW